jgi:hypothetical protein
MARTFTIDITDCVVQGFLWKKLHVSVQEMLCFYVARRLILC